jgi:hypothetical protein
MQKYGISVILSILITQQSNTLSPTQGNDSLYETLKVPAAFSQFSVLLFISNILCKLQHQPGIRYQNDTLIRSPNRIENAYEYLTV